VAKILGGLMPYAVGGIASRFGLKAAQRNILALFRRAAHGASPANPDLQAIHIPSPSGVIAWFHIYASMLSVSRVIFQKVSGPFGTA
jgi:hypothetical protein